MSLMCAASPANAVAMLKVYRQTPGKRDSFTRMYVSNLGGRVGVLPPESPNQP
jgi:hypothetical protein